MGSWSDREVQMRAQKLWNFMRLGQKVHQADGLVVCGSSDLSVAKRAADILLEELAPWAVVTGGLGKVTRNLWQEPEAVKFAEVMRSEGVGQERILLEPRASNGGENITLSRQMLKEKGLFPKSLIIVHKPYFERRALASFKKQWPGVDFQVTSPVISFKDYMANQDDKDRFVSLLVGDVQRMKVYVDQGFQVPVEILDDVWEAMLQLKNAGFDEFWIED